MVFLKKLSVVMFYAALPLFLPLIYSLYKSDGAAQFIAIPIIILMLPALPQILTHIVRTVKDALESLRNPEVSWNYTSMIHIKDMEEEIETLTMGHILALTSIAWLLVPAISSLPYLFYGFEPVDALFESMSGWTSTGLTAVKSIEVIPRSLILFRSITQWIGGLGIVILMLTVVRGSEAYSFLKAEGRSSSEIGIGKTVSTIWKTYIALTILGILLLVSLKIDLFNSINLTMAGLSNGGFFPFDSYEFTELQKFALAGLMFAGATYFLFYKRIARFQFKKAMMDEEFIFYVLITIAAIFLIVLIGGEDIGNTFLNAVSAIAAGGFAIGDLEVMHNFSKYLLILLMISGGMLGSTTGGIKLRRILLVLKSIALRIKAVFLPSGTVQVVKINGKAIYDSAIIESAIFIFSYVALLLFASGLFIAAGFGMEGSLFTVASAIGNVGLSTIPIYSMSELPKLFLMVLMYLGRIEIFPSLALASYLIRVLRR
jgi:trk system potassium uptake protein TrkH